jgi:hypothetical protein
MYLIPQRAAAAKLGALLLVIMCLSCALAANVINIAALVTYAISMDYFNTHIKQRRDILRAQKAKK